MVQKTVLVLLMFGLACLAQDEQPIPAPDDVLLTLRTQGGRQKFYLGEPIAVEYSYTAVPRRYLHVSRIDRLTGGRPLQVECNPAVELTSDASVASSAEASRFQQMLIDPGCRAGFGGGVGGGCGDCDQEYSLGSVPVGFGLGYLNRYVRFRQPGVYSCRVTSAQVTTAAREEKIRPALFVKSNWVEIGISDDSAWAHSAALAYAAAYGKDCRGDDVPNKRFGECSAVATRLSYLDTVESVAMEIQFFDGRNHGWDDGLLDAITTTSHRSDALRLLRHRILEPEVDVSDRLLNLLATWSLQADDADAFQSTSAPSDYHDQAKEQLRKYVRLLGTSLAAKNSEVLEKSLKTYQMFAEERSCKGEPLIPDAERAAVLGGVKSRIVPRPQNEIGTRNP
jgi:hypothetical protein